MTALNSLNAHPLRRPTSDRVRTANWNLIPRQDDAAIGQPAATFDLPREIYEMNIRDELTEPYGVSCEKVLISVDENQMDILLTDASVPSESCGEIVADVVSNIFEKAIGKKLDRSQIAIKHYAHLSSSLCEHCLESIDAQPYRCRLCGRCFCYLHRSPETHGCAVEQKVVNKTAIITLSNSSRTTARSKPQVILRRIPCG